MGLPMRPSGRRGNFAAILMRGTVGRFGGQPMQFPGHIFGASLCCAGHGLPSAAGDQKGWQQTAATYTDCLCALEALLSSVYWGPLNVTRRLSCGASSS